MAMTKAAPAADPDAYVAALDGWRRACVVALRAAVRGAAPKLREVVKWGHLVYLAQQTSARERAQILVERLHDLGERTLHEEVAASEQA